MSSTLDLEVLPHARDLPLPRYMTDDAAGLDLCAAVDQPVTLAPGARALVPTGLKLAIARGFEGQVRPRSGLALKHGVTVLNAPGTIDADFRGQLQVILVNLGQVPFTVQRGERIAQLVIAPVTRVTIRQVPSLESTLRGEGGFGHTGVG